MAIIYSSLIPKLYALQFAVFFQLPEYTVSEDAEIVSVCISTNESIRDPINLITRDDSATGMLLTYNIFMSKVLY